MASLYKKRGIYYLAVQFQKKRIARSLGTSNLDTAKALMQNLEKQILLEIINGNKILNTPINELVALYLEAEHGWKPNTKKLNTHILNSYLQKGYPQNQTTHAMTIRVLNGCNRWGYRNKLIASYEPMPGGNNYEARTRVFTGDELNLMFNNITPKHFNLFVQFAYYTGVRSGEIRQIKKENVFYDYIVVFGKTGKRIVKLNKQAKKIIDKNNLWNYTVNYVQSTWSRNRNRLGITDARFHDLRRTFGLNLIKQGMSIYKVSKLLGHSSVRTTEQHYAPLLTVEIEDFEL